VQARKDWRERALTHAGRVPSERVQRLELPAEPAPGAARRRSPRAAFPSPGPRPHSATLTRRLRRSATEGNGGRKAATHLDYAHPPHALALAHEMSPANCRTFPARRPMMFWQSSLEHLAMWPPRHTCGCHPRFGPNSPPSPRTLGAPARDPTSSFAAALISLGDLERISARSALPRDQGRKRLACGRSDDVGAFRNLLFEPRHAPGLCFYSMYIGAGGEKQESHWARQRQRLSYLMPHAG